MQPAERMIAELGNEPPLLVDGRGGPPDKREISARWLSGTFLTGVTSSVLLGVALFAALDGREQLATPPEIATLSEIEASGLDEGDSAKMERIARPNALTRASDRRRMEVSTIIRSGDRELIRTIPFVHVKMALAAGHPADRKYPAFDPLDVFSAEGDEITATTGMIYDARVESDVNRRSVDFPLHTARFDQKSRLSAEEVEEVVRATAAILTDGAVQVAALHYVDPQRFGTSLLDNLQSGFAARIVPQNVSIAKANGQESPAPVFSEEVIPVRRDSAIADLLERSGHAGEDAGEMAASLARILDSDSIEAGSSVRLGIERLDGDPRIVRASLYNHAGHMMTVALDDHNQFVRTEEPEVNPLVAAALDEEHLQIRQRGELPSTYDGIYRAAFAYGLSKEMTRHLIRILAAEVDFKARLKPSDQLELFFSRPDEKGNATAESELLYVRAVFDGKERNLYRFQMADAKVDYFTREGRSARQFLLRNPLPNGRFRSGFGMRRHPILKYSRMHTGVDWSAPRGTPIISAGHGTVLKAGWSSGYGKQTQIQHANGYVSSYSHQNAIAKGVVPGARVRQGQVIGYVGSTGLSTGPHLHYELVVNGTKVDPMRVRLPSGKALQDEELEAFISERDRIDALLQSEDDQQMKVASANAS